MCVFWELVVIPLQGLIRLHSSKTKKLIFDFDSDAIKPTTYSNSAAPNKNNDKN